MVFWRLPQPAGRATPGIARLQGSQRGPGTVSGRLRWLAKVAERAPELGLPIPPGRCLAFFGGWDTWRWEPFPTRQ